MRSPSVAEKGPAIPQASGEPAAPIGAMYTAMRVTWGLQTHVYCIHWSIFSSLAALLPFGIFSPLTHRHTVIRDTRNVFAICTPRLCNRLISAGQSTLLPPSNLGYSRKHASARLLPGLPVAHGIDCRQQPVAGKRICSHP